MTPVPPGDRTGVYYIIVANLPFSATWQALKDFGRNRQPDGSCIDVEHAYIYPNSGDGWIRVRGKANFKKCWHHLNNSVFGGRALIADDRNEKHMTYLRDPAPIKTSSSRMQGTVESTTAPMVSQLLSSSTSSPSPSFKSGLPSPALPYSGPASIHEWSYLPHASPPDVVPVAAGFVPISAPYSGARWMPPQSSNLHETPTYYVSTAAAPPPPSQPPGMMMHVGNMTTPVYTPYFVGHPAHSANPLSATESTGIVVATADAEPAMIKTETWKIMIAHLPHDINERDLRGLLQQATRGDAAEHVELAKYADGKGKGHAFAVFESYDVALRAVEALQEMDFGGRKLSGRFAKEGAVAGDKSGEDGEKDGTKREKNMERKTEVEIMSRGGSGGGDKKEKAWDKENQEKDRRHISVPMVVDGTFTNGRARKEKSTCS